MLMPAWRQGWRGRASATGIRHPVRREEPPPLPFANLGPIRLFDIQPVKGRLDASRAALGDSEKVRTPSGDCRSGQTLRAPVARGMVPRLQRQEPEPLSYADATAFAASLATTLMVSIVVFQAGDGTHAACPAAEFDGDDDMVKLELDPWE